MPRVVVLGTGTSVGKTYVTEALSRALKALRPDAAVVPVKPVESGYLPGPDSDAARLARAASGASPPTPHPLFGLEAPVSPHLAARRAGVGPIDPGAIAEWLSQWETGVTTHVMSRQLWSIVETAGALFSPLAPSATNFELALALEPALWVLVAPDALGVLHDVRVTWEACARRGRQPDYLLLSAARAADASTGTNFEELRALGIASPIQALARDAVDLTPLARALLAHSESPTEAPG
jgi:dethiobiotin synthetase